MPFELINPESLGAPRGYSNGVLTQPNGRLLFIAGQVAWNSQQQIVGPDFVEQFDCALANLINVVTAAGGTPQEIARLVLYVTDKRDYLARTREIGERWRQRMGNHYPAMSLVEVKGLVEDGAKVEIEGIAVIGV